MNTYFLLSAVFNAVLLIAFILLVVYVASIKRAIGVKSSDQYFEDYVKYRALGDFDRARFALREGIWLELKKNEENREEWYNKLKWKYQAWFDEMQIPFPTL